MTQDPTREFLYWHALISALGTPEAQQVAKPLIEDVVDREGLPRLLLDPRSSMAQIFRQAPELHELFSLPDSGDSPSHARTLLLLKSILNVFGHDDSGSISAEEFSRWQSDVRALEAAFNYIPGQLTGRQVHSSEAQELAAPASAGAPGPKGLQPGRGTGTGGGPPVDQHDLDDALTQIKRGGGLMAEPDIKAGLASIEKSLIGRMQLREVLKDPKLAAKLKPSMALTEQLLRDKDNLEGPALAQAKRLIKSYVDELGTILLKQVERASLGTLDRRRPPKRTFRNLDIKQTLWKNLKNWDPKNGHLLVDKLVYRRHVNRNDEKTKLIVVVDQSGSMVPAMVNCTILASIFALLPYVEPHLVAYDTEAIDLSNWVQDPFEVLLRTQLGGGTDGMCAVPHVQGHLGAPKNTVIVWISDFYDNRDLMPVFKAWTQSGFTFIPVGSVSTSGYFSVDSWFRTELKAIGRPILSGSLKTLIHELKNVL